MQTSGVCPDCRETLPDDVLTRRTAQVVWSVTGRHSPRPAPTDLPVVPPLQRQPRNQQRQGGEEEEGHATDPMEDDEEEEGGERESERAELEEAVQTVARDREAWRRALGEEEAAKVALGVARELVEAREAHSAALEVLRVAPSLEQREQTLATAHLELIAGKEEVRRAELEFTRRSEASRVATRALEEVSTRNLEVKRAIRIKVGEGRALAINSSMERWSVSWEALNVMRTSQDMQIILNAMRALANDWREGASPQVTQEEYERLQTMTEDLARLAVEGGSLSEAMEASMQTSVSAMDNLVLAEEALTVAVRALEARSFDAQMRDPALSRADVEAEAEAAEAVVSAEVEAWTVAEAEVDVVVAVWNHRREEVFRLDREAEEAAIPMEVARGLLSGAINAMRGPNGPLRGRVDLMPEEGVREAIAFLQSNEAHPSYISHTQVAQILDAVRVLTAQQTPRGIHDEMVAVRMRVERAAQVWAPLNDAYQTLAERKRYAEGLETEADEAVDRAREVEEAAHRRLEHARREQTRTRLTPEEAVAVAARRVSAIELLRSPTSPSTEEALVAYREATGQTAARAVALQEARRVEEEARDVVFRSEARAGMRGTQGVTTIYG